MSENNASAPTNGTVETATIALPKFRTIDGRGTCGLDFEHAHLRCPLIRVMNFGRVYSCALNLSKLHPDNPDGTGYLRPCKTCPIHNHE